ncbi:MAG: YciI family protein [Alphaproteobacteria bacterium]
MFVVFLKFSDNKDQTGQHMDGHMAWLKRGFDDGVFLAAGALKPDLGGGIVASNTSRSDLESRVNDDPFVANNVVTGEIYEIAASMVDERLEFLKA